MEEVKPEQIKENSEEKKISKPTNYWKIATLVLGLIVIVLLILQFTSVTGNVVNETDAGTMLLSYLNSRTGGGVELVSTEDLGNLYMVTVSYQEQDIPVYMTKDGEYFVQGISSMRAEVPQNTQQQEQEIVKSDNPEVELFIWSYCPYGVQAQGPLAEVAFLLGDDADFKGILYYDGHGAYETQQNKIQACIQEVDKEKYWDYAASFVKDIYPNCGSTRDVECDMTESVKLMKSLGIDDKAVLECVEDRGEELLTEHRNRASELGVTGSPTIVINGVKVSVSRNAEAFKGAVCDAFNDAPEECSTVLDSSAQQQQAAAQC